MKPIMITVAIPSYNKEKYIEKCILSVMKDKDFIDKIILVDNKSTDRTFEISKKYEPEIDCYQNEKNLGMSGNFNRCINLCDTDWLMIMHADDELVEGSILKYREIIEKYPSLGLIHADGYSMTENDKNTLVYNPRNTKEFWLKGEDAMTCHGGVCSAVMVKMEAYHTLGNFIESSLSSDVEMWARIASKYNVGSINSPTVIYRNNITSTGPQSLINRSVKEIKEDWDLLDQKIYESIPDEAAKKRFLENKKISAPYNYYAVFKANLRARKIKNVLSAFWLIIREHKGFFVLVSLLLKSFKKKIQNNSKNNQLTHV